MSDSNTAKAIMKTFLGSKSKKIKVGLGGSTFSTSKKGTRANFKKIGL